MNYATIFRTLGVFLMIFSLSMWPPMLVAFYYGDGEWQGFLQAFFITLTTGILLWAPLRKKTQELKVRDGFLIVVLFWTVLSVFAAIPFMMGHYPHLSASDAFFEAISGLTTTGSTVLNGIDFLPHAILYYRQQLQFLGGMGIVILAVAITPMLGIGGMQLYRAETTGPAKDTKLTPRITETAKALWAIYVGLTIMCALCYWIAGMSLFDAIGESFSTVSTGGFAMHDDSFSYYDSGVIELLGAFFMIIGGVNFSLYFISVQQKNILSFWSDDEFRTYIYLILIMAAVVAVVLIFCGIYATSGTAIIKSIFNVVSLITTTGFTSAPFQSWPTFLPLFMMMGALIGGCASSTSGGLKVVRVLILLRQSMREIRRLIHPRGIFTIKLGTSNLSDPLIQAVWGFIAAFFGLFALLLLALSATGLDLETAFGSLAGCLANAGVGLGAAAGNFSGLNEPAKWILCFAMLAGRLEIFTLLVIFTPDFWRK